MSAQAINSLPVLNDPFGLLADDMPMPDANGEFSTPAEGAKFMASFGLLQTPLDGKAPRLKEWQDRGSTDFGQIDSWYAEYKCNFGTIAKAELGGVWILECDSADVRKRYTSETGNDFTSKFTVRSSSDTRGHRYYRQCADSIRLGNLAQGFVKHGDFSVRVNNQQCVSPGSISPKTGEQYRYMGTEAPQVASKSEIDWLWAQKAEKKTATASAVDSDPILDGKRNDTLTSIAGRWQRAGVSNESISNDLHNYNEEHCQPPLPRHEVDTILNSVCGYKKGNAGPEVLFNGAPGQQIRETTPKTTGTLTLDEYKSALDPGKMANRLETDESVSKIIPPFDPSVMTGIPKKMVDLATKGTTLSPQFVFGIAKTLLGARMADNVRFEYIDVEPRRYFAAIGETGTGKGEAWRRVLQIIQPKGTSSVQTCFLKIIDSADSGAGLKDFFFESPEHQPVVCYIDEMSSLGNKAAEGRNPDIMDTMFELADGTSITRVLAKGRSKKDAGGTKRKNDARLVMVICGQDGHVYAKACAGRNKLGIFDRLTPEYAEPVEAGDMPEIDIDDAMKLLSEFNSLPYGPVNAPEREKPKMTIDAGAKNRLDTFWQSQSDAIRKKARFRKNLILDVYVTAFGESRLKAEMKDVEIAIKNFDREMVIRQVHFQTPVADQISYYIARIKEITNEVRSRLAEGVSPEFAALTRRDYETRTRSYQNNEGHIFQRAWQTFESVYLTKVQIPKDNGQYYVKYLPIPWD